MIKIIRFNKKKVISFLGLKKNKNFTFNKWVESITNFKNTFIDQKCLLEKIFDRRGFLLYRKFPLFINYIHKKFIVFRDRTFELSSKLDKKFILSYYGYYLNCLDEDLFRRLYFLPKFNYNLKLKYERDSFDLTKLSVDLLYYLEMIKSMIRRQQIKHRRLLNLRTQLLGKYDFNVSLITSNRLDLWNWSKSDLRNFNTIRVPHTWRIHLRETYSNYLLMLTDSYGKVIKCCTAGSAGIKGKKKLKTSPKAIAYMFKSLHSCLQKRNIKYITMVIYNLQSRGLLELINNIEAYGLNIISFDVRILRSHNGIRKRKSR